MNDLPTLSEFAALWPMWLLFWVTFVLWFIAETKDRQTRHWHRLKRRAEIAFAESERQRQSLQ
jgi:hypothetical protein